MDVVAIEIDIRIVGLPGILIGRLKGMVQQLRSDRTGSVGNTRVRMAVIRPSGRSNDQMNSTTKGSTRPEATID